MIRKFGWKPNLPDKNVKKYAAHPEMDARLAFPPLIDMRPTMSPIEDQGQLGSCVAHATCGSLEYLELLELKQKSGGQEVFPDRKFDPMSRLFIYFNARSLDGDPDQDNGTQLSSAVKAIQKWGISRESLWPYNPAMVNKPPVKAAYLEGAHHLVLAHYSLNNAVIDQLKQCLCFGYPFIFGISVYDSFMSEDTAATGLVPMPGPDESLQGGHALCCVGYDDSKNAFIVRNSWGTSWGDAGYCYIPYDYLTSQDLAADFWTLRKE